MYKEMYNIKVYTVHCFLRNSLDNNCSCSLYWPHISGDIADKEKFSQSFRFTFLLVNHCTLLLWKFVRMIYITFAAFKFGPTLLSSPWKAQH